MRVNLTTNQYCEILKEAWNSPGYMSLADWLLKNYQATLLLPLRGSTLWIVKFKDKNFATLFLLKYIKNEH